MDTLHRLFSGQSLGGKRWWLVVVGIVLVTGLTRPLLFKPSPPRAKASASPTASPTPATTPAAATQPAESPAPEEKTPSLLEPDRKTPPLISPTDSPAAGMFWRMLGSLVVVIAMIVAGWFFFRRHLVGRTGALGRQVTLLESARVGSRQNVLLVQAGSRKFLLAATPERITLVADVTEACPTHEQPRA